VCWPLSPSVPFAWQSWGCDRQHSATDGESRQHRGLIFTTRAGTPLEPRNTIRTFKAPLAQAGLPDIRFHDLRHSCAALLVAAGHHPRVAMETQGHSQIGVTMEVYSHVYSGAQDAVAATMDALFPATMDYEWVAAAIVNRLVNRWRHRGLPGAG
jgi:integrase